MVFLRLKSRNFATIVLMAPIGFDGLRKGASLKKFVLEESFEFVACKGVRYVFSN